MKGHDAALADIDADLIGRRHVAHRLHRLLTKTPSDWSVRVGLLGDWGEGKTTVATWARALAERDGHLVAWFAPIASATAHELWSGLARAILDAADAHKVPAEATSRLRSFVIGRDGANRLTNLAKANPIAQALHSAAAGFLAIGPSHLRDVRAALGPNLRVVVVLDDLDRADPRLLPGLLLALRDVLDMPGFSFLLPFDEEIVATSLQEYNRAWGDGRRFLDKILDFRVRLPAIAPAARKRLFDAEANRVCPFLPANVAIGLEAIFPANPRRLKALVRTLSLMAEEAQRHHPDELDWRSAIFASVLRDEADDFFHAYFEDTFSAIASDGRTLRNRQLERLMDKATGDQKEHDRVQALLKRHASHQQHRHAYLWDLCDAWLRDTGIGDVGRVHYTVRLLEEASEGISWADHDRVVTIFHNGGSVTQIAEWITEQATARAVRKQNLSLMLIRALCAGYGRELEVAAQKLLLSEHASVITKATISLNLLEALADSGLPDLAAADVRTRAFPALLSVASQWERFNRNPADADARARELALLTAWADTGGADQPAFREAVDNAEGVLRRLAEGKSPLRETLRSKLLAARPEALGRLTRRGGISELLSVTGSDLERTVLLDPNGSLWRPSVEKGAEAVLAGAKDRPEVQENAKWLLDLLWLTLNGEVALQESTVPEAFLKSGALAVVWAAATATPLQFRMLHDLRERRATLVAHGADETALPMPAWLEAK